MKKNNTLSALILSILIFFFFLSSTSFSKGILIPTDTSQVDFMNAYKYALYKSYVDYRFNGTNYDSLLFPLYGEDAVYWAIDGPDRGKFILPESQPGVYTSVSKVEYDKYDWQKATHYTLQFKPHPQRIAIFNSKILFNSKSVSWQAIFFKNLIDSYLYTGTFYNVDEKYLNTNNLNGNTQLLIIPSFTLKGENERYYIDSVLSLMPNLKQRFDEFLSRGGTIYAEGNACYLLERLSYLDKGSINFDKKFFSDSTSNLFQVNFINKNNPISFTELATGNNLYGVSVPEVKLSKGDVIASLSKNDNPVVFLLKGADANGGRIICNTGLPTTGGMNNLKSTSPIQNRQLSWSINAIVYSFCSQIDYTRSIFNVLPAGITAGPNAVSHDRIDTFEVRIKLRNLSDEPQNKIDISELIRTVYIDNAWKPYYTVAEVSPSNINYTDNLTTLNFKDITLQPRTELNITYKLVTPNPDDPIHEKINSLISWATYIFPSYGQIKDTESDGNHQYLKYRNYIDMMFAARLAADTDLNWKNILGLYYQPFKVFMIMENKERTSAESTKYVQYIPKDVPFYWTDNNINIPILRTPGGKYVDVLKGSNDQNKPEFDMNSNGKPDAWLDTASIYPKNYTLEETEVYWLNPWQHLRTGDTTYYEDIDHDGIRAVDLDGDGIVDIDEPGDKIRVWKVTWNIGRVNGYEFFDPYCYYEIWIDPPDLVGLSAGVGYAKGTLSSEYNGKYYPYTPDINKANLADTSWSHWMERDANGLVQWKQLIWQKINNYEGYTYVDTTKYKLLPTDIVAGTVPVPHNEYIAVLSLGGEEIDMTHPTPVKSLYSNLFYNTIFGESKVTPIRTTYTYYAPLPNPLQFEYLTNSYKITDDAGNNLKFLPKTGKVNLSFEVDASTEYSYYWIRNAGHDVDYNDPSEKIEGDQKLGDGVFGYFIYDLPKGLGGYSISLPKKSDGTYDLDKIVQIDGHSFAKWLDNPNTKNQVEIWEDQFQYHVYVPQLLIPPALDDNNFDGIDDWIDDRGDRFQSSTGFLHDQFMLGIGEEYKNYPEVPFKDDIYGWVKSGWFKGADSTYGDDFFEKLGKTHISINAIYEGKGKEGPVDISKGGWLVVEEIFGGSPWVIFSHTLSGYAEGVDYRLYSGTVPSIVKYGIDTTYIKHIIEDPSEPHKFDSNFDPYHVSYGYGNATITTTSGGKDPCGLTSPVLKMSAIIDPKYQHQKITLIPAADANNPELKDYPRDVEGTFLEVIVEVTNATEENWINSVVTPVIPKNLGNTKLEMSYVASPRPLVPAAVDPATGKIIQGGDDLGTFRVGWRFNQPEGEVLLKIGNKLPLMQPTRRGYFVFLFKIDESLSNGVYNIGFDFHTNSIDYTQKSKEILSYEVPPAMFSITPRNSSGNILDYQKLVVGNGNLNSLKVFTNKLFKPTGLTKWSFSDINNLQFDTLPKIFKSYYNQNAKSDFIDLTTLGTFPTVDKNRIYMLEQGEVYSFNNEDKIVVVDSLEMAYQYNDDPMSISKNDAVPQSVIQNKVKYLTPLSVTTFGPKLKIYKKLTRINNIEVQNPDLPDLTNDVNKDIELTFEISNSGNDIAENVSLELLCSDSFEPISDLLPQGCTIQNGNVFINSSAFRPGEIRNVKIHYKPSDKACVPLFDKSDMINQILVSYKGGSSKQNFTFPDDSKLLFPAIDIQMEDLKLVSNEIRHNSLATVSTNIHNGIRDLKNVDISLFRIVNKSDTAFVKKYTIDSIAPFEIKDVVMNFLVPDNATYLEAFAVIDADKKLCEVCENNNSKTDIIPILGPYWIQEVTLSPNPIKSSFNLSYYLPREMKDIQMTIYDIQGRKLEEIQLIPNKYGFNNFTYNLIGYSKGSYVFQLSGTDILGDAMNYLGKFIID